MLKIKIIAVGKLKDKFYTDAAAEYLKRLSAFCDTEIIETAEFSRYEPPKSVEEEGREILPKLTGAVIVLDSGGDNPTSGDLTQKISDLSLRNSTLSFVIGGSHGLSSAVKSRADYILSFGKLTYPHRLARIMLLEQLYRAFMITAGRSYHK